MGIQGVLHLPHVHNSAHRVRIGVHAQLISRGFERNQLMQEFEARRTRYLLQSRLTLDEVRLTHFDSRPSVHEGEQIYGENDFDGLVIADIGSLVILIIVSIIIDETTRELNMLLNDQGELGTTRRRGAAPSGPFDPLNSVRSLGAFVRLLP